MPANWKTQQWPWNWKRSVFILVPKKGNAKECSNYHTVALISHASKVMLKILQAWLQQLRTSRCSSWILKRQRNQRSNCQHLLDHQKSKRVPKKHQLLLWTSLVAQTVKRLPIMQETQIQSLGQENLLEKEMATHSSILAWRIPWTEEPGRLQSMGLQRRTRLSNFTSLRFTSALWTMSKPLTVWITTNCGKFFKR